MAITCFTVLSFGRSDDGKLVTLGPVEVRDAESACRRAFEFAVRKGGAIAFSRTGDPNVGEFSDAVILATYGEVDRAMLGE